MNIGFLFWLLFIILIILSIWFSWPLALHSAPVFFAYVLIFLLGLKVFGKPIQG